MDPVLSSFMSNLRREASPRKLSSLAGVGKGKANVKEIAPPVAIAPCCELKERTSAQGSG